MYIERHIVPVTTAADGSATVYTPVVTGRVLGIRYLKTDFDNGSTMTATMEATGEAIWAESNVNASASRYPRVGVHDAVGVAATLDGTRLARDYVHVAKDRVKIVIASGGNAKSGEFHVLIG